MEKNEENLGNDNNVINGQYNKLKMLHDNLISESNKLDLKDIYFSYYTNRDIIFQDKGDKDNVNLKKFFQKIKGDIIKNNNILFPFLNFFPDLIKAYILSDLDDELNTEKEIKESVYLSIISQLKNNCFINRQAIFPLYEYFSEIYDILVQSKTNIEEKKMKKFFKVIKLFNLFYIKNTVEKKLSSFCLLGKGLILVFNEEVKVTEKEFISIKLTLVDDIYIPFLNDESNLCKFLDVEIKYKDIKHEIKNRTLKSITFDIYSNNIITTVECEKKSFPIVKSINIEKIEMISLLEKFYGQIFTIDLTIQKDKSNYIEYKFRPISIRDDNCIYYRRKNEIGNKVKDLMNCIPMIKLKDKKFVRINYINYNDTKLDLVDYFGGITQFLPFHQILKKISENKNNPIKIELEFLNNFYNSLLNLLILKLFSSLDVKSNFKNHCLFIFYLILDIDLDLNIDYSIYENKEGIIDYIELLLNIYYSQKNTSTNVKELIQDVIGLRENTENTDLKIFTLPERPFNQIYCHYMKELFCFNNLWSKKIIFFPKRYNNESNHLIKYRQLNYYTKNFIYPFLYPILEYKNYRPLFYQYEGNIFKEDENKVLQYNFELGKNEKAEIIIDLLCGQDNIINDINTNSEKCCMVKSMHHVAGELFFEQNINDKNKNFDLVYKSSSNRDTCNFDKSLIKKTDPEFKKEINLCYGAFFACPTREFNKKLIIKSNDILFMIMRVYYQRTSGLEIFTINKNYYFNFYNGFEFSNIKTNKILNKIKHNTQFKELKLDKLVIGYYNPKYKPYLYPLFEDKINSWEKKLYFYSNFDTLILTNIFSNRSFRDVYQYPVFPTLYDILGLKRALDQHIGLQSIDKVPDSIARKDQILKNYSTNSKIIEFQDDIHLFNIYYSNPAYVFHYLLRVIPFTFLSIEFQGDNFDNPNRLFYSMEKTLYSTLKYKTDLRELVPELFFLIELYFNHNEVKFDPLVNGGTIDSVIIKDKEIVDDKNRFENYFNFICDLRKNIEQEENVNYWIDLIFGSSQKIYIGEKSKYKYYSKNSNVLFKSNSNVLSSKLELDRISFGLIPSQLFTKEFPQKSLKDLEQILLSINKLLLGLFSEEHIKVRSPINTFICKGSTLIDENFIKIIEPKETNKFDYYYNNFSNKPEDIYKFNKAIYDNTFFSLDSNAEQYKDFKNKNFYILYNYYFIGDVFGNVLIYGLGEENQMHIEEKKKQKKEAKNKKKKEYNNFIEENTFYDIKKDNYELNLIFKASNHTEKILFIDYNNRLNIFLSYALDEFINIYLFPKCKLINVIDTYTFRNSNDRIPFDEVALLNYPFPIIVCYNYLYVYLLSINGKLIKYKELDKGDKIVFTIDKQLGIFQDKADIIDSQKNKKETFNYGIFIK